MLAALASMAVYRLTSRQRALADVKARSLEVRERLKVVEREGDLKDMWPLVGRNLALAGRQLGMTFVPATIATIPVLLILAWMSNAFDARPPEPGSTVEVTLVPAANRELPPVEWRGSGDAAAARAAEVRPGVWSVAWPAEGRSLDLHDSDGVRLLSLPTEAPVRVVEQRRWWNGLIGNQGGYLPSPGDVDSVRLALPRPAVVPFGPEWVRGWLPASVALLIALSLFLKVRWRLH
jgi:hypothetical protein